MPHARPQARQHAARLHHPYRGAGARRCPGRRGAADGRRRAGPARRHPDRPQGHHRHQGHPHHLPLRATRRQRARHGRDLRGQARRGGHGADGQAVHARIRQWRTLVRPALAAGAQPVEPGPFHLRLQQRHRRRGALGHDPRRPRHRHRRLDPRSRRALRHRRHQAHLRSGQPRGRLAGRVQPRPYRPDGMDLGRLRHHAAGARRPRPARPREFGPPRARLRRGPPARREGPADRGDPSLPRGRQQGQRRHAARHRRRHRDVPRPRRRNPRGHPLAAAGLGRLRLHHLDDRARGGLRADDARRPRQVRRPPARAAADEPVRHRHRLRAGRPPAPRTLRRTRRGLRGRRPPADRGSGQGGAAHRRHPAVRQHGAARLHHAVQRLRLPRDVALLRLRRRAGCRSRSSSSPKPFAEATLFRAGHAFEQATEWRHRRPALEFQRGMPQAAD